MLASPEKPYILDTHCTVRFFDGDAPSACPYEAGTFQEQFNTEKTFQNVNVTIQGNATTTAANEEQLCWDGTDSHLVEAGNTDCDVPLRRGDSPPSDNSASVTAQRVVSLDGEDVTVFVVVW